MRSGLLNCGANGNPDETDRFWQLDLGDGMGRRRGPMRRFAGIQPAARRRSGIRISADPASPSSSLARASPAFAARWTGPGRTQSARRPSRQRTVVGLSRAGDRFCAAAGGRKQRNRQRESDHYKDASAHRSSFRHDSFLPEADTFARRRKAERYSATARRSVRRETSIALRRRITHRT